MKYNLTSNGGEASVTAFIDGEMYIANQDHINWNSIVAGCIADDNSVVRLFNPAEEAARRFERLTDRISVASGKVYFDGDHVDNVITEQILGFLNADEDFGPLVNFMEKLYTNPQEHARTQLYGWMKARPSITITPDGDLIAYKGVQSGSDAEGAFIYRSTASGTAMVNGEVFEDQQIPQRIGDTVEMPRSEVQFDPRVGCSAGLHAGTFDYSGSYGDTRVRVAINPRDVVSVPTEHNEQKIRVCRYVIIDIADKTVDTTPVYSIDVDEDDVEYCYYCGGELYEECDGYSCEEAEDDDEDDDY